MKKYIPFVVVFVLIFISYELFSFYQSENLKKEETLAFSNKQKCASYLDEINKSLIKNNGTDKNLGVKFFWTIQEIWFSENKNSCLYTTKTEMTVVENNASETIYVIHDYLTNSEIGSFTDYSKYLTKRKELE